MQVFSRFIIFGLGLLLSLACADPGDSYFGRNDYIEYIEGDLPLIFSAPHGGRLTPDEIPDRTGDITTNTDDNTHHLARTFAEELFASTGHWPHVIICHLKRTKLDANREIIEAAQGNEFAIQAWTEFHAYIDGAKKVVEQTFGHGLYIDVHGHGHALQRVELGYLLSATRLEKIGDAIAEDSTRSSIRALAAHTDSSFTELLRGGSSFGGLLQQQGYPSVPSPEFPDPGGNAYFSGGENTRYHGSRDSGNISGFQMELYRAGIRDNEENRVAFAKAVVATLESYLPAHYGLDIHSTVSITRNQKPYTLTPNQRMVIWDNRSPIVLFSGSRGALELNVPVYSVKGRVTKHTILK